MAAGLSGQAHRPSGPSLLLLRLLRLLRLLLRLRMSLGMDDESGLVRVLLLVAVSSAVAVAAVAIAVACELLPGRASWLPWLGVSVPAGGGWGCVAGNKEHLALERCA